MNGVPPDLPIQGFVGKRCNQIALGKFEIQFHFEGDYSISVQGGWDVCDASGERVDRSQDHSDRSAYCVHKLLDSPVERYLIEAPRSFTLTFQNGYALTVFNNDEQYESFSIQPGNIYV